MTEAFRRLTGLVWYLFLALVSFYMAGWYQMYGLLVLAALLILVPISMYILSWYLIANLEVSVRFASPVVRKGEAALAEVAISNRGIFPVSRLQVVVSCSETGEVRLRGAVAGRGEAVLSFPLSTEYCGGVAVNLCQLRVTDYLNFFLRKKRFGRKRRTSEEGKIRGVLTILPSRLSANLQPERLAASPYGMEAGDQPVWEDSPHQGRDPYEIRQLRPFRPGDSLRDIHWKISARTDELMSKQYGGQEDSRIRLILDLRTERKQPELWRQDAFREVAAALSAGLLSVGVPHMVCWYDDVRDLWMKTEVSGEEGYLRMAALLVHTPLQYHREEISAEERGFSTFSDIWENIGMWGQADQPALYLDTELNVYLDRSFVTRFSAKEYVGELEQRRLVV